MLLTKGFIQQAHTVIGCARSSDAIDIDMDAFYTSVEQRDNPSYTQQTLVVAGSPNQRGVVAVASDC